jgi:Dolichyl-phosphate-mannose-protein mannosyltransferase
MQPTASTRSPVVRRRIRLAPALALAGVLAWSGLLVSSQPVRSPWWTYADADATYTATALNLTYRNSRIHYLDHPGLPLHELLATSFVVERLVRGLSEDEFFTDRMLNLDSTRPLFRGWAIFFYLLGAALSFLTATRLLGHWTWGLAAGLLWTAAPGLVAMSIQYRADVLLSVVTIAVSYTIVRAALLRSAGLYLAAGLLLGLAVTVKLHAAGLIVPLAIAALWRPPPQDWYAPLRENAFAFVRRRSFLVGAGVFAWLALVVTFNAPRVPFTPTAEQLSLVAVGAGVILVLLAVNRFYGALAAAIAGGIAVSAVIVLQDGLQMLVVVTRGLTGGGINEDVAPFTASLEQLRGFPLRQAAFVFLLAAVAAAVGLVRREPTPVLLFSGAAVMAIMAQARLGATHYFAPAYVLSVPAALWLLRTGRRGARASVLVWPMVALIVLPQYQHRRDAGNTAAAFAAREEPALRTVERRLEPGEVALVPGSWPHPDNRYFESVYLYSEHTPDYEYHFLPDYAPALAYANQHGLRPRYFVGPVASTVVGTMPLELTTGTYTARPLPGVPGAVELLAGPSS